MTDMIITMRTNAAIPAAEYTYSKKSSVEGGTEVVLTARKPV